MKRVIVVLMVILGTMFIQAGEELNFKSDILFKKDTYKEDIKNILKEIAKKGNYKIQFDESVEGKETFDFNMPLKGAFNMIMEKHKLNYKIEGDVILVSGAKIEKKIIVLTHLKASALKKLLDSYDIIDKSLNRLEFGKGMDNTVFIEGKSDVISELEELIGQLEKAEQLKKQEKAKKDALLLAEKEKKEKAELAKSKVKLNAQEEARKLKKLKLDQDKARLQQKIAEQKLEHKDIVFNNQQFDRSKKMVIDVIPLKYINVSQRNMEFQGEKIQLESLEETLKGLIGINSIDGNSSYSMNQGRESAFLKVDKRTNSVIIKDFPERVADVRAILRDLDKAPILVEIEVTIAMGNSGFTQELGVKLGGTHTLNGSREYGMSTGDNIAQNLNQLRTTATTESSTTSNGAITSTEQTAINSSFQSTPLLQPLGALGLSSSMLFVGGRSMLNFQLNAMENEGLGKVLSNPRIITLNNREATILSGDTVSIPTATADKMSLETIETGISIMVKPHVVAAHNENLNNSDIMLDIGIEKSSLGIVTREKIETSQSTVHSNVIIRNGQTLILGGLFQYTKSDSEGGVPLLKDIPLLGMLFKTKNKTLHKNELLFFITPRIVTTNMVDKMQNNDYMHYKKSLEVHKNRLTESLNKVDSPKKKSVPIVTKELPTDSKSIDSFFEDDDSFNF